MSTKKDVAKKATTDVTEITPDSDLGQIFGAQMKNADADSFSIPFLKVLQSNSPFVLPQRAEYVEEAKVGQIINTVTKQPTKSVLLVPVYYLREFLEWDADSRGKLLGRHAPDSEIVISSYMTENSEGKRIRVSKAGSHLQDTRQHYVIIIDEEAGTYRPAMLPMSGTQVRRSKDWMGMIQDHQALGKLYAFNFTTAPESNDKGDWWSWKFAPAKEMQSDERLINEAIKFIKAIQSGLATADFEADRNEDVEADRNEDVNAQQAPSGAVLDDDDDIPF